MDTGQIGNIKQQAQDMLLVAITGYQLLEEIDREPKKLKELVEKHSDSCPADIALNWHAISEEVIKKTGVRDFIIFTGQFKDYDNSSVAIVPETQENFNLAKSALTELGNRHNVIVGGNNNITFTCKPHNKNLLASLQEMKAELNQMQDVEKFQNLIGALQGKRLRY